MFSNILFTTMIITEIVRKSWYLDTDVRRNSVFRIDVDPTAVQRTLVRCLQKLLFASKDVLTQSNLYINITD